MWKYEKKNLKNWDLNVLFLFSFHTILCAFIKGRHKVKKRCKGKIHLPDIRVDFRNKNERNERTHANKLLISSDCNLERRKFKFLKFE